jgi:Immunoglobulin domain
MQAQLYFLTKAYTHSQTKSQLIIAAFLFIPPGLISTESRFLVTPKHQEVIEGATAEFECQTPSQRDNVTYTWYYNDNIIHLHGRVYLKGSNLVIRNVNKTVDAGDYVCVVESQLTGAREASPPAKLNVLCKYLYNNIVSFYSKLQFGFF